MGGGIPCRPNPPATLLVCDDMSQCLSPQLRLLSALVARHCLCSTEHVDRREKSWYCHYDICPGVCYTVPLVGGRIADMVAGRFNTIFASFLILFVGTPLDYTPCSKNVSHLMFDNNFGKCGPIFKILSSTDS